MTTNSLQQTISPDDEALIARFLRDNVSFLAPDQGIVRNHHLLPRTAKEQEVLAREIDLQQNRDVRGVLTAALDETFEIVEQTAAAPAAKCADMSAGVFTATGELSLTSNRGVSGFAAILSYPIRFIIKYFETDPSVGIREGDAFIQNDARYGGVHSPDLGMFMPVFHNGERIAWVACSYHQGENGAREPGGMGPAIESPWDEGFKGSPMRLAENYQLRRDLVTLLQNSSREPHSLYSDLKARLGACRRLEQRVHEAIAHFGADAVIAFLRKNLEDIDAEVARRLHEIPPTTVRTSLYLDSTMREDALLRLRTQVTFGNGRVVIDLRGSSPEIANRPINAMYSGVAVGAVMALTTFIWPDLPASPVLINRFDIITDPRSLVDASCDVPIALCMQSFFKVITALEIAFAKATYGLPKRYSNIKAPWFNQPTSFIYGGITQHFDSVGNVCGDLNGMAGGAKFNADGEHSISPNFSAMVDSGECEDCEENLPFQYLLGKVIAPDNCGFGRYRGGSGYQFGLVRLGQQPFGFQAFCGGSKFPSTYGLFGGYGCPVYPTAKIKGADVYRQLSARPELFQASMAALLNNRPFEGATYESCPGAWSFEFAQEGDLYIMSQGAGGGYGDVLQREPAAVMKDVEEGIISTDVAREIYFVAFDDQTLVVDEARTRERRDAERAERVRRGLDWDAFVAAETTDAPKLPVPFFGSWNRIDELFAGELRAQPGAFAPIYLPDPRDLRIKELEARLRAVPAAGAT
jgi:N-methylhydantoinase B/oxoprolinase/acetone carboxylase alpha subunit